MRRARLPITAGDVAFGIGLAMGAVALFAFGVVDYRNSILSTAPRRTRPRSPNRR